jgi:uncharacterized protein YjbI with pentapeptide repeats
MAFRTLKPFQLGVLFRTVDRRRALHGCFSLLTMTARSGEPTLKSEPSLWKALAQHAPEFVEAGVIKSQPEFLVFGHAYAYDGQPQGVVGVQFAETKKWFRVFGPRRYPEALQPAAFEKVRLDWRHAYGGPDFPGNPAGTGRVKDDSGAIVLPHFEVDGEPWAVNAELLRPVGFGPLDITHPDRQKLAGTYDGEWLETEAPGLARDADWRFFQVAPEDQRLGGELRGDEPYDLAGVHPTERLLHGRLPGVRPRLFIERDHQRRLSEVHCRLRTVVFLPDADAVVQIWQGTTPVGDEDASELTHILAGLEGIDRPKDETHYAQVMAHRLDERDGMLAMLNDADLLPPDMSVETLVPGDVEPTAPPPADSFRARQQAKHHRAIEAARAEAASRGLDPDTHAPPLPGAREAVPPPHLLGEYRRELDRKAQEQIRAAAHRKQRRLEETAAEFAARGESFDDVLKQLASGPVGPPTPRAPALLEDLQKRRADRLSRNTDVEGLGVLVSDADLHERWLAVDRSAQQMYEQAAHFQAAAPRAEGQKVEAQRQWVADQLAAGAPLRGFDLTGADLRGFDLRGAILDGAMMESACLDGVDLRGASAKGTVLAHASFEQARADDCDFSKANLGKVRFAGGHASRAEFAGAILSEADFTGAVLQGARFADVRALHMKLAGADLSEAVLDGLLLYQTDLSGTRFVHASLNEVQFLENRMDGADFTGARGRRAVFLKVRGEKLRFDGADLSESTFVQEPALPQVSMRGTQLRKVFLHGADLTGADLFQANLDGAELGYSRLQGANLRGATAREAGLRFVDLSGARVVGADLRGALLANAKVFGTRFDRTSLFMSDLSRIRVDTDASFDGVNFGRARRYPRCESPQP